MTGLADSAIQDPSSKPKAPAPTANAIVELATRTGPPRLGRSAYRQKGRVVSSFRGA